MNNFKVVETYQPHIKLLNEVKESEFLQTAIQVTNNRFQFIKISEKDSLHAIFSVNIRFTLKDKSLEIVLLDYAIEQMFKIYHGGKSPTVEDIYVITLIAITNMNEILDNNSSTILKKFKLVFPRQEDIYHELLGTIRSYFHE